MSSSMDPVVRQKVLEVLFPKQSHHRRQDDEEQKGQRSSGRFLYRYDARSKQYRIATNGDGEGEVETQLFDDEEEQSERQYQNQTCVVCLEELGKRQGVRGACNLHHFHYDCIQSWMKRGHDECPTCQQPLWEPEEYQQIQEQIIAQNCDQAEARPASAQRRRQIMIGVLIMTILAVVGIVSGVVLSQGASSNTESYYAEPPTQAPFYIGERTPAPWLPTSPRLTNDECCQCCPPSCFRRVPNDFSFFLEQCDCSCWGVYDNIRNPDHSCVCIPSDEPIILRPMYSTPLRPGPSPNIGPSTTAQPTVVRTKSPFLALTTTEPPGSYPPCNVCGLGKVMTSFDTTIQADGGQVTCYDLNFLGTEGQVDPRSCSMFLLLVANLCGCV